MIPRRRGSAGPVAKALDPKIIAPLNFKKMFDDWVADTQKKWGHDRKLTLGGSEVFGCIRKAWYSRNGTPKDADYVESWGALRRGDIIENYVVVPAMDHASAKLGFGIKYHGEDQNTLFAEEGVPLSVTPDGLLHGLPRHALKLYGIEDLESDCCMLEIKSIDPRVDLSEEKAIHHGQTQIQMGLIRETTEYKPMYAVLLYINASFLDDIDVFVVRFDEEKYQTAKDRASLVYNTDNPEQLMREGRIDGSCQYCPFQGACLNTVKSGMPQQGKKSRNEETDPELVDALEPLLEQKRELKHAEKKATKEHALVAEEIKQVLREFGKNRAKGEGWSVSYSLASGKKALDTEALAQRFEELNKVFSDLGLDHHLDMEEFMKEGNPYEIMRATFKEPEQDDL